MNKILSILVLCTTLVAGSAAVAAEPQSLHLENLKSVANTSNDALHGPVFVYIWASWCQECREKLSGSPSPLTKLKAQYPKYSFITINADRDAAKGLKFAESESLNLPIYRDEDRSLTKGLKLFAVPAWAIVEKDANGEWRARVASTGAELGTIETELRK